MKMIRSGLLTAVIAVVTSVSLPSFAETLNGSVPQLAAGQSLGRAMDIPAVPNHARHGRLQNAGRCDRGARARVPF